MESLNHLVLGSLNIVLDDDKAWFKIVGTDELLHTLHSDFKVELSLSIDRDYSLRTQLTCKFFHTDAYFASITPASRQDDERALTALQLFLIQSETNVVILNQNQTMTIQKKASITQECKEMIKRYLGELLSHQPDDGLAEAFAELPEGFCAPYANHEKFSLICPVPIFLLNQLKIAPSEQVSLDMVCTDTFLTFRTLFQLQVVSSITLYKDQLNEEIIEDLHYLLLHKRVRLTLGNSQVTDWYLSIKKDLSTKMLEKIALFLTPLSK